MRLEHYPVGQFKKEILGITGKHLDLSRFKVFVFGSRVTGKGSDRSDIDVGILGPYSVEEKLLGQMREDIDQIKTLYTIDLVDFSSVSDDFKKVALEKIEPLN